MSPVSSRRIIRSSPSTISGLNVEAPISSGNRTAGRKLANRPSSLRSRSRLAPGRIMNGISSSPGMPAAPNRIASARFARSASDCAGRGSPAAVDAGLADRRFDQFERMRPAQHGLQHLDRLARSPPGRCHRRPSLQSSSCLRFSRWSRSVRGGSCRRAGTVLPVLEGPDTIDLAQGVVEFVDSLEQTLTRKTNRCRNVCGAAAGQRDELRPTGRRSSACPVRRCSSSSSDSTTSSGR